jgi:hypothetical protein
LPVPDMPVIRTVARPETNPAEVMPQLAPLAVAQ